MAKRMVKMSRLDYFLERGASYDKNQVPQFGFVVIDYTEPAPAPPQPEEPNGD